MADRAWNSKSLEDGQRPSKRQRNEVSAPTSVDGGLETGVESAEAEEDLLMLVEGDSFLTKEAKAEAEANQRREKRRLRLLKLKVEAGKQSESAEADGSVTQSQPNQVSSLSDSNTQDSLDGNPSTEVLQGTSLARNFVEKQEVADADDAEFDMFSSSVSPVNPSIAASTGTGGPSKRGLEQQDWDDAEGYYKAVIGESIEIENKVMSHEGTFTVSGSMQFKVAGLVGKGVFSTVLKCTTISNTSSVSLPPVVAIKLVRHNETMAKAAASEIKTLQGLKGLQGIVSLILPTTASPAVYRGHTLLVFPFLEHNLREVLQKFGKGVGLSLQATQSYFAQLLGAAAHLKKQGIIHADWKPDNILVSGDFSVVQLADFGSSFEAAAPENQPTPYMVSRFYRAPEIILGLTPTFAVDLWSLAVSMAEVFLGDVLFRGKSNNEMLYVFMQHLGPFSNRILRQHLVQCQKVMGIQSHFRIEGATYVFTQQTADPVNGAPVHRVLSLVPNRQNNTKFPLATPLAQRIMKAKSPSDSKASVAQFGDLLTKCLALDPQKRLGLKDSLQHSFFTSSPEVTAGTQH